MLRVEEISAEYDGMIAIEKVSVVVEEKDFVSIVGPNGAGKSTLLKSISGTVKCNSGKIYFNDKDITRMEAYKRTRLGIIHIPENRRIFPSLTVMENLEIGGYRPEARNFINENTRMVFEFFPMLKGRQTQLGGTLSGGEQQMLAIGRGLMAMPTILMLDEPSLGLSPLLTETIFEAIKELQKKLDVSIFLVEQRAAEALELCKRAYILEAGRITMSGNQEEMIGNPKVQKAYLGSM
jgi:branched-chain amino acid transport system ATP-binding protein